MFGNDVISKAAGFVRAVSSLYWTTRHTASLLEYLGSVGDPTYIHSDMKMALSHRSIADVLRFSRRQLGAQWQPQESVLV